ncbi:hypothetical protein Tco_0322816 [Tanacetum coccineum]
MVAFLEKSTGSAGFHQIIDFLNRSHICYALTKKPEVCVSFIKQFWRSAEVPTAENGEVKITATIDGHSMTITEGSLRRHLKLDDQDGISSIPNSEIFEQLALMGYHTDSDKLTFQKGAFSPQWRFLIHSILHCLSPKKTAWEQFSSNIATAVICLATNRKYNFSRMIFEHMVSNISSPHKFLMYPRFIQICLDMQMNHLQQHPRTYIVPSLSMKVFNNMKRPTKGFSGQEVALFPTMLDVTEPSTSPSRITSSPSHSPEHSPSPTHSPLNLSTDRQTVTYTRRRRRQREEEIGHDNGMKGKSKSLAEAKSTKQIDWNDPLVIRYHTQKMKPKTVAQARKNMINYLKNQGNYKIRDFKGIERRKSLEKSPEKMKSAEKLEEEDVATQKVMKEVSKETGAKRKKSIPRKSTRKRQKMEEDAEKEELKGFLDIKPIGKEEGFPVVDWKTCVLTENFMYYQVFRGDGSSKNYKVLSEMLEDFDRQDVEELYRLVKEKYSASRLEGYDLMLWGDLYTLFESDEEDEIWKNQHEYNLISWRLCDFCGIHILLMENRLAVHMLTEKKYLLSQELLSKMLSKKLEVDHESSQEFELLRFIKSQVQK